MAPEHPHLMMPHFVRAITRWGASSKCRCGRRNRSKHGSRLSRLHSVQSRTRQPMLWVPPAAPESAIDHTRSGAERRTRTTVATLAAAQNGTSVVALMRSTRDVEPDVRKSDARIQSRRSGRVGAAANSLFGRAFCRRIVGASAVVAVAEALSIGVSDRGEFVRRTKPAPPGREAR